MQDELTSAQIVCLAEHQQKLRDKADEIIGLAIRLKHKLKGVVAEPLPDPEMDDLIFALSRFVTAAEKYPR